MTGAGEVVGAKIVRRQMAGGRTFAEILHNGIGSIFDFRFHLETGSEAVINGDSVAIDPLFRQRLQYEAAKAVVADAADPADLQTQARQAGGDVQLSAGDTFHKMLHLGQIAGFGGDKHGHSFADGDDI